MEFPNRTLSGSVETFLQRHNIRFAEPPGEISRRRRIRDPLRVQSIEKGFVLAPLLDVLQTHSPNHDVVGDVQHMIALVVGQMHFEQMQTWSMSSTNPRRCTIMHGTDPAAIDRLHSFRHLVMNVAGFEHRDWAAPPNSLVPGAVGFYSCDSEESYGSFYSLEMAFRWLFVFLNNYISTNVYRPFRVFSFFQLINHA